MELTNTHTFNFEGALRGMRNPMNSWNKSDSYFEDLTWPQIGPNDLKLAQRLILSGSEHGKFMRQIFVSVDITAPIYWWKEMDTYKVSTVSNSTSTMHKLASKPITFDDFSFDNLDLEIAECPVTLNGNSFTITEWTFEDFIDSTIDMCEDLRYMYNKTKDKRYWRALIQLLPESYNQTRTWTANYAILRNIYFQRKNHKLMEWHKFCEWIETLPYAKELITLKEKPNEIN